jgi:nicotinamide riboside transporter PnuC
MINLIGWVATILTLANIGLLSQRKTLGWPCGILGNILWVVVYIVTGNVPALTLNIILLILSIIGWANWSKQDEHKMVS